MIDHSHSSEKGKRLQSVVMGAVVVCVLSVFGGAAMIGQTAAPATTTPGNAPTSTPAKPPASAHDGFELPTLGNMWMTLALAPESYAIESDIVRAGHSALRITLRPHDVFMAGRGGDADNERDELIEAYPWTTRKNVPYEVSWSMYLPQDFPIVPVRLVVAQWWEYCRSSDLPCSNDSPVLAVRYIGGELLITQDLNHLYNVLYREKRDLRGRWLDLRFQVKFTPESTGFVRAWLDGKQVVDFAGATSNPENATTGYGPPVFLPFKMGLYRNVMPEPMTIYFDEYRKTVMEEK
jgi:hypothetical protein